MHYCKAIIYPLQVAFTQALAYPIGALDMSLLPVDNIFIRSLGKASSLSLLTCRTVLFAEDKRESYWHGVVPEKFISSGVGTPRAGHGWTKAARGRARSSGIDTLFLD